ncbi:MAG: polyphenol oxidase family protein [Actinomycetaceae bacterium]
MSVPVRVADLGPAAHGMFTTAHGGVSRPPWAAARPGGLNLGPHVGDDPADVAANRRLVDDLAGMPVAWMTQVHGTAAVTVAPGDAGGGSVGEADVLLAVPGDAGVSVGVMVADCVPLLLADGHGRAAAAVHVGRAGLLAGVVTSALSGLEELGVPASDLHAHLGPSICGRCYEVPSELAAEVVAEHPAAEATTGGGTTGLDVGAAVVAELRAAGVGPVDVSPACTYEDPALYSYRRATHSGEPRTGRFAGVVTLPGRGARRVAPRGATSTG